MCHVTVLSRQRGAGSVFMAHRWSALLPALLGLAGSICSAVVNTPINVPNSSFENPENADGSYTWTTVSGNSTTIPGWTFLNILATSTAAGTQNSIDAEFPGTTGPVTYASGLLPVPGLDQQYVWLNLYGDPSAKATLTTTAPVAVVQSFSQYTLTVAMGDRLNEEPREEGIALLINGSVVPGAESWMFGTDLIEGGFIDLSVTFTTGGQSDPLVGGSLAVMLEHRKPVTSGVNVYQADYDNVRLTIGAVPEPIFGVALLAALPGVSLRRKRHQLV